MFLDYVCGARLGLVEKLMHRLIDGMGGFFGKGARPGDLAPKERVFLALAHVHRSDRLRHTPARDHGARQRGRGADIVVGARTYAMQKRLLCGAPSKDDGEPILQIFLGQGIALFLGQLLSRAEGSALGR